MWGNYLYYNFLRPGHTKTNPKPHQFFSSIFISSELLKRKKENLIAQKSVCVCVLFEKQKNMLRISISPILRIGQLLKNAWWDSGLILIAKLSEINIFNLHKFFEKQSICRTAVNCFGNATAARSWPANFKMSFWCL